MRSFTCAALLVTLAGPVSAGMLATGVLFAPPDNLGRCELSNLSGKALPVVFRLIGGDGTLIDTMSSTVGPGLTDALAHIAPAQFRCEFDVSGRTSNVRAEADVTRLSDLLTVVVLPAQ